MEIRVHDNVKINTSNDIQFDNEKPDWVDDTLKENPYVIVRRAPIIDNYIPVGIRGTQRHERVSGYIHLSHIIEHITPEDIVERLYLFDRLPQLVHALSRINKIMEKLKLQWGIIGSIAYEIVTKADVATDLSDIDIIIRDHQDKSITTRLLYQIKSLPVRVDILIEKEFGSYSLKEFVESKESKTLVKTIKGPKLVKKTTLS